MQPVIPAADEELKRLSGFVRRLVPAALSVVCLFLACYTYASWRLCAAAAVICLCVVALTMLMVGQYVARLRRAVEVIRESEWRGRSLSESNIIGIYSWKPDGTITEANDAFLNLLGLTRDALRRGELNSYRLVAANHVKTIEWCWSQLATTGRVETHERIYVHRDGSLVTVLVGSAKDAYEDRGVTFVVDRTPHEKDRQELLHQHRRLRALFENGSDGVCLIDAVGLIMYATPAGAEMVGRTTAELPGTEFDDLVHADDRTTWREICQKVLANPGVAHRAELRLMGEGGNVSTAAVVCTNYLDDALLRAVVVNYRDITGERQLEEAYRHAQKMEAIGTLAGGVAHDFNNILSVILTTVHLLSEETPASDPRNADIREIRHAAERARDITRHLLAFSRRQAMSLEPVDLRDLLLSMEVMLRRLTREDITLTIEPAKSLAAVMGDRTQLEQVFMNLVVNARDAIRGTGNVSIRASNVVVTPDNAARYRQTRPGDYVLAEVQDTGEGMDPETMAHVFEPFFTTKAVGEGTGLGLSTVFGIVQQCGGIVWAESLSQRGSTFFVLLPVAERVQPLASDRHVERRSAIVGSETILLVEDDDGVRRATARILSHCGFDVIEACDPAQALDIFAKRRDAISLVLSDLCMPKMDGVQLVSLLRAQRPSLKYLLMSGYADRHVAEIEGQAVSVIEKPFVPEQLVATVRRTLDDRGTASRRGVTSQAKSPTP